MVAGTVKRGVIAPNSTLLLGPDIADGTFKPVTVKSVHYKRLPVGRVRACLPARLPAWCAEVGVWSPLLLRGARRPGVPGGYC